MRMRYADLINDDLELTLRRAVSQVLKAHKLQDNVVEADLVSVVKAVFEDRK